MSNKVAIVVPPYFSDDFPSLEAGIFHSAVSDSGNDCKTIYLNQLHSNQIGESTYKQISNSSPEIGVGEWIGGTYLRCSGPSNDDSPFKNDNSLNQFTDYIKDSFAIPEATLKALNDAYKNSKKHLDELLCAIDWSQFSLLIFSCRYQQLAFSLSISKMIKENFPGAKIFFAGNQINTLAQSKAVVRNFNWVDGVLFDSPALTLAKHVDDLINGASVPTVVYKTASNSNRQINSTKDEASGYLSFLPDYGRFYQEFTKDPIQSILPYQASYGCWWGDKSTCSFCGLLPEARKFESRNGNQMLGDIEFLVEKHETMEVGGAGLLFDYSHFNSFLPALIKKDFDIEFYVEVRPGLSKNQVEKLRDSGVSRVEMGIESLDSIVLRGMRKGTSSLQNIQTLKWCAEFGINVVWSYLVGLPEENMASVRNQAAIINKIIHLQPPIQISKMRVERNSPIYKNPESFGVKITGPSKSYSYIYPVDQEAIMELANRFEYTFLNGQVNDRGLAVLSPIIKQWGESWRPQMLYYQKGPNFIKVCDFRNTSKVITLRGWRASLFDTLDQICNITSIQKELKCLGYEVNVKRIKTVLHELSSLDIVISEGNKWLSVVPRVDTQYKRRASIERAVKSTYSSDRESENTI